MTIVGILVYSGLNNPLNTRKRKEFGLARDGHTANIIISTQTITNNPPKWFLPSQNSLGPLSLKLTHAC